MKLHYKAFIFFSILLFLSFTAEEKYLIEVRLLPNTTYRIVNRNESVSTVTFQAEEEILSRLRSSGVQFPTHSEGIQEIIENVKTGDLKSDSSFDVNMHIEEYKINKVTNGIETVLPDSLNFTGMQMHAIYTKEKKLKDLEIEGDKLSKEIKAVIIKTLEKMIDNVKFPDYPLAIGDTFKQETPIDIPVGGGMAINLKLIVTSTLMDVKDNKARFKTNTEMAISNNSESYSVRADGGGEGELINDMELKYYVEYTADLTMNFEIKFDQFTVITETRTKSTIRLL